MSFFDIKFKDKSSNARVGEIRTSHSIIETPVFMPVGTNATVKTLDSNDLINLDFHIILGNAYHLYFSPGIEIFKKVGGIHNFMKWPRSVLTDSGGFQVYSLSDLNKIRDEGVEFRYHKDGSKHFFTPEKSIETQVYIGSDIIMSFDHCPPGDAPKDEVLKAVIRTSKWAERGFYFFQEIKGVYGYDQFIFGINQGGIFEDLRDKSLEDLLTLDFDGYAIGGLSVGEEREDMYRIVEYITPKMPEDKPRYLMGVGTPRDILEAIEHGVDMFDCVYPTRNARNGTLYTFKGKVVIKKKIWKDKIDQPVEEGCGCYTCQNFSVGYLHHLFKSNEILALRLATIHNLYFYNKLIKEAREHIKKGDFKEWKESVIKNLDIVIN